MSLDPFLEYNSLRNEQTERIKIRDSYINFDIVSVGILLSVAFGGSRMHPQVVLCVPWVALAFGWVFVINDVKVAMIGKYLSQVVIPKSSFSWDRWRLERNSNFLENKYVGLMVQVFVFVLPSVAALVVYPILKGEDSLSVWEILILILDWVITLSLAFAFYSGTRARRRN